MNWQIVVGVLFLIGGIGNIATSIPGTIFGVVAGAALLYWGLKKKGYIKGIIKPDKSTYSEIDAQINRRDLERKTVNSFNPLTPDSVSNLGRRYHYQDVNIWVNWQYSGQYGKSCESIRIRRGDIVELGQPLEKNDDPEAIAIFWKDIEIGHMKSNRMRSMVHQWKAAGLPVLSIVSHVGTEEKLYIEFAFYGSP